MPIQGYTPNRNLIQISSGSTDNWDTWYNQTLGLLDEPSILYKISAAENISQGQVAAILDDGFGAKKAYLATSATYTFGDPIGISTETVISGNPVHLTLAGRAQNNGWSFGAPDKTVYLSASGTVTTTTASVKLGYVISSTAIFFRPEDFSSTGGQTNSVTGASGITNTGDNVNATLAPTYGSSANTVCQGNDSRLHTQNTDQATSNASFEIDYTGNSARLMTTGLNANRDFTFPDATTKLMGETAPATVTGDHDYSGGTLRLPGASGVPTFSNDKGDAVFDTLNDDLYVGQGASSWKKINGGAGGGEANTASNVGIGGVGVFKQKTGVDLEFKKVNAGSSKITITDDTVNNEVDIDVAEANLNHDSIGGILSISKGGTGQSIKTGAFDALAPATTKGDITVYNGTDNIRVAVGSDGQVLTADSVQASGVKWAAGGGGGLSAGFGAYSNLKVKPNITNPAYQVDIDADSITLASSTAVFDAVSVNLTVDITVSGVNGRDTGSEASSTWYAVWVIYDGTTVASLLSVSSTAPTMPSGYTYKRLVGFVRNDGSSNFVDFNQWGDTAWFTARNSVASGLNSTSYVTQDVSSAVPSASGLVKEVLFGATGLATMTGVFLSRDGVNAGAIFQLLLANVAVGQINELYANNSASIVFMPINGNNVYYKVDTSSMTLYTRAFKLNNL